MEIKNKHNQSLDEISIYKLIVFFNQLMKLILKKWYVFVFAFIVFAMVQCFQISKVKPTYPANIKLFIKPQNIAKENKLFLEGYAQIISSKKILEEVLFSEVTQDTIQELLINKYLNAYFQFNPEGLDNSIPPFFQFKNREIEKLDSLEFMVLLRIVKKISTPTSNYSDGFVSVSADYDLGFITINVSTPAPQLSILILEKLYKKVKQLLIKNTNLPYYLAFKHLKEETDSLSSVYKKKYYQLNINRDKRLRLLKIDSIDIGLIKSLEKKIYQLEVEAEICKTEYLASIEQLKLSQVEMDQKSLLIYELEKTHHYIEPYQPSVGWACLKGGSLGLIGILFFFVIIQILMDIKKEMKIEKSQNL